MCPVIFEFFGFKAYSYGLFLIFAFLFGYLYISYTAKKELNLSSDSSYNLLLLIAVFTFLGGKFLLFFESPAEYIANPKSLFTGAGFVFYGSLIFNFGVLYWFIKKHKLPAFHFLDISVISICIMHFFGRLGCFFAGCCFGTPTECSLGVTYTDAESLGIMNQKVHPVQLYEAFGILTLMCVLLILKNKSKTKGVVFASYLMCYAIIRFVVENFRGDEDRGYVFNGLLSHSQLVSLFIFSIGTFFMIKVIKENKI